MTLSRRLDCYSQGVLVVLDGAEDSQGSLLEGSLLEVSRRHAATRFVRWKDASRDKGAHVLCKPALRIWAGGQERSPDRMV